MMRLVIAVLLLIMAASAGEQGRWLAAAANAVFAVLAGMLAYRTLPDRPPLPRTVILGILAAGVLLWIASLVFPGV